VRDTVPADAIPLLARVKRRSGSLPVAIGFGVSGPAQVAAYATAGADGVIVGSALVKIISDAGRRGERSDLLPGLVMASIREMVAATAR